MKEDGGCERRPRVLVPFARLGFRPWLTLGIGAVYASRQLFKYRTYDKDDPYFHGKYKATVMTDRLATDFSL